MEQIQLKDAVEMLDSNFPVATGKSQLSDIEQLKQILSDNTEK